ncbi:MAG: ATP-binding protein [Verrucomicrobia bacterium]|nr:ATP-binding protein [Verrucomicrobiota bacterium]
MSLPPWAAEMRAHYESHSSSQFLLSGNINDRFLLPTAMDRAEQAVLGGLTDYLAQVLMPRFDIILSYDLGNGLRVEKGREAFAEWPSAREAPSLPKQPRPAVETLTHYFRYLANIQRLGKATPQVGVWVRAAHLVAPNSPGSTNADLNALALLMRDWSSEAAFDALRLCTVLLTENQNDLHPLLVLNPRALPIKVPFPDAPGLGAALQAVAARHPIALGEFAGEKVGEVAASLSGATLGSVESLLKIKEYRKEPIRGGDLAKLKKELVEREASDLIEFIDPKRTLDDLHAQEALKQWLRDDIALWKKGDTGAVPMGYLLCGPVGTGKTYMVECLAGEAGIPVVKIKNFRDKWVGSTEGNLEKIFRLLQGLGRCFVFVDEADQALGKRDSGGNDGGLSGRIYSMFAKEMSNPDNRGKLVWILASSRPDLIEVDLKRPGRIDVKIPIFPTTTAAESWALIRALCKRRGLELGEADFEAVKEKLPLLLTPGAAEALAVKIYRTVQTKHTPPAEAVAASLVDYQPPVSLDVLKFQIGLAVAESSDPSFVPAVFRS